jgi:hypothetical protein
LGLEGTDDARQEVRHGSNGSGQEETRNEVRREREAERSKSKGEELFEFIPRASKNQNEVKTFFLKLGTTDQRRFF